MTASIESLLAAASETGAVVAIPGLLSWLGRDSHASEADFRASVDGGFTESFEDYCTRISKEPA